VQKLKSFETDCRRKRNIFHYIYSRKVRLDSRLNRQNTAKTSPILWTCHSNAATKILQARATLCLKKNIPNIFDCDLKTNGQILIILGFKVTVRNVGDVFLDTVYCG